MPTPKRAAPQVETSELSNHPLRDRATIISQHYELGRRLTICVDGRTPPDPLHDDAAFLNPGSASMAYKAKQFYGKVSKRDVLRFQRLANDGLLSWTHLMHLLPLPRRKWDAWIEVISSSRLSATKLAKRLAREATPHPRTASPGRKLGRPFARTRSRQETKDALARSFESPFRHLQAITADPGQHPLTTEDQQVVRELQKQLEIGFEALGWPIRSAGAV